MAVILPDTAPSPREVEALAVVEETERLIVAAHRWLATQLVVDVQEHTGKAAVRHAQPSAG
jgi:hypothetical protein